MILSFLVFFPLVSAIVLSLLPLRRDLVQILGLLVLALEFLFSLSLFFLFDPSTHHIQLAEKYSWISPWGISYFLGLDGISFWFVLLTTFIFPFSVVACFGELKKRTKFLFVNLLILETCVLGSFLAFDSILFYVFFEASLIPMFFIIGIWGGKNRIYACFKFFIFTFLGSVFMLVGLICLMFLHAKQTGYLSSNLLDLYSLNIPFIGGMLKNTQSILFFIFSFAFAVKTPLFPVHTWLPDAHVQAPSFGSVFLASLMLKMGTYGFLRFVFPLFPEASLHYSGLFCILSIIGIIYGAMLAYAQTDVKKLVAYSSVSHMAYVILGLFSFKLIGFHGGFFQMLAHGISTGALFLLIGMLYEKSQTKKIADYGGLAKQAPIFSILFFIFCFSSMALPLTAGFVGEFYILLASFLKNKFFGIFASLGVILGAFYLLRMMQEMFFGKVSELKITDINLTQKLSLLPFVILIFWMGIFPNHFLDFSKQSLKFLLENKQEYRLEIK